MLSGETNPANFFKFNKKNVRFISLHLPYLTDMVVNKQITATLATFDNERRKERQQEVINTARAARKYLGRKTVIDKK